MYVCVRVRVRCVWLSWQQASADCRVMGVVWKASVCKCHYEIEMFGEVLWKGGGLMGWWKINGQKDRADWQGIIFIHHICKIKKYSNRFIREKKTYFVVVISSTCIVQIWTQTMYSTKRNTFL